MLIFHKCDNCAVDNPNACEDCRWSDEAVIAREVEKAIKKITKDKAKED